jgi:hypothetical protein
MVHGGGNALLKVAWTFDLEAPVGAPDTATVAQLSRTDGLSWQRYGFAIGQRITLPNGAAYTITGFADSAYGLDSRMFLGGGPAAGATTSVTGTLAVSDHLAVTSTFTATGNRITLANGQAWQSLGFAVGQQVYITGVGLRNVIGFDNDAGTRPDGTPLDGAVLLVDGAALAGPIAGTVSVASRYRATGALTLVGSGDGGTVTVAGGLAGSGLAVGQQVWISGVNNGPRTIESINGGTITLSGGLIPTTNVLGGTLAAVRIGGDTITLAGPSFNGGVTTTATTITRAAGSWVADGFAAGQKIVLGGGLAGTFAVTGVTAATLTLTPLNGSSLAAGSFSATVTVLPVGAGPGQPYDIYAPLVIYGDTTQDGVWYGGDPKNQSLHNFGPKPMPHVEGVTVTISRSDDGGLGYTGIIDLISCGVGCNGSGDFRRDGFAVAQQLALGPPTVSAVASGVTYDIWTDRLTASRSRSASCRGRGRCTTSPTAARRSSCAAPRSCRSRTSPSPSPP